MHWTQKIECSNILWFISLWCISALYNFTTSNRKLWQNIFHFVYLPLFLPHIEMSSNIEVHESNWDLTMSCVSPHHQQNQQTVEVETKACSSSLTWKTSDSTISITVWLDRLWPETTSLTSGLSLNQTTPLPHQPALSCIWPSHHHLQHGSFSMCSHSKLVNLRMCYTACLF